MELSLNILLIEDNPGDAFLLKFYLEESILKNSKIIHVEYLKTATDQLAKDDFDIIILDLNLPDSNGIDTLSSILSVKKSAIIIVLTGLQDEEVGAETVRMGAHDFLVKGQFDGKVFNSSVRYAYESAKLRKEVMRIETRFNVVQKLSGCGYWRVNLKDKEVMCSSFFNELLGLKKEITTIKSFTDLFVKEDHEKIKDILSSSLTSDEETIETKTKSGKNVILKLINSKFAETGTELLTGIIKFN